MKRFSLLLSVVALTIFSACKEVGPNINLGNVQPDPDDTTYVVSPVPAAEARNVLIEEFTGVSCPNCPAAHLIIKGLKADNPPGRIVAISLYMQNMGFTDPRPGTDDDFRTEIASIIGQEIYAGGASSLPIGGIDRVKFNNTMLLDRGLWASNVNNRLQVASPVNLSVTSAHSDADSSVKVKFTATFTESINKQVYYSIAIVQDSIVDAQETPTTDIEDYLHTDVLREFISANDATGVALEANGVYEPGRVIVRTVTGHLKSMWKPEHCKVIVFLHYSGTDKEVLQAKEIELK